MLTRFRVWPGTSSEVRHGFVNLVKFLEKTGLYIRFWYFSTTWGLPLYIDCVMFQCAVTFLFGIVECLLLFSSVFVLRFSFVTLSCVPFLYFFLISVIFLSFVILFLHSEAWPPYKRRRPWAFSFISTNINITRTQTHTRARTHTRTQRGKKIILHYQSIGVIAFAAPWSNVPFSHGFGVPCTVL